MDDRPRDYLGVPSGEFVKTILNRIEYRPVKLPCLGACLEHPGAKHRDKGEGRGRGDDHDDTHDPAQLLEHDASHS